MHAGSMSTGLTIAVGIGILIVAFAVWLLVQAARGQWPPHDHW
jgi:hypothetical protein